MSKALSQETIDQISTSDDEQRTKYFFKEVVTHQEIWLLIDEHGCVMLNTDDEDCVPVWPNQEFALKWATQEWQTCKAEPVSLAKWFSRWTQGLSDDELSLVVFPNDKEQGLVFYPEELEHELKRQQKKGQK